MARFLSATDNISLRQDRYCLPHIISFGLEVITMNKNMCNVSGFLKSLLPVVLLGVIVNSPALAYELLIDLGANV